MALEIKTITGRYTRVETTAISSCPEVAVLTVPSLPLAINLVAQKGRTPG